MASVIGESPNILVYVGSTNRVKAEAARAGVLQIHPGATVEIRCINANHGITKWRSDVAPGQPFGLKQTLFGAVNRMQDCFIRAKDVLKAEFSHVYVVGFENGLVKGSEIGKDPNVWYDICVTSVKEVLSQSMTAIRRGKSVATEFGQDTHISFDDKVRTYHALITPKVQGGVDLYREWTSALPGGPFTRADFLQESLVDSLQQLQLIEQAKKLVIGCASHGMCASLGPRYRYMLWMRDLAYMAPVYLMSNQKPALLDALRTLSEKQCVTFEHVNNGYEEYCPVGSLPIVVVPERDQKAFLLQRLQGTEQDPYWQKQLWSYCEAKGKLSEFPMQRKLEELSLPDLRTYYHTLLQFRNRLAASVADSDPPPTPSFALRCFMQGSLGNLTPGTRDSEIHFIRAIYTLCEAGDAEILVVEFAGTLARAVCYLYNNVIDSQDGLPKGCDSRDIFADLLYDAKCLSNAIFWYGALKGLRRLAPHLEISAFRETIKQAIGSHPSIPEMLKQLAYREQGSLSQILLQEEEKVKKSITEKLLFKNGAFSPRDFLQGSRTSLSFIKPVTPSPANDMIIKYFPQFPLGEHMEPQSLALAVLEGLVPEEAYSYVVNHFQAHDSPIGCTIFVPISGKTKNEESILHESSGRVVWPHVSWTIVRALIAMNREDARNLAYEQRDKLSKLGFAEWYALHSGAIVRGGDPEQGWSASSMMLAEQALSESSVNKEPFEIKD